MLAGVTGNSITNSLICFNGAYGIEGISGSNATNNTITRDTFIVTIGTTTYGNKLGTRSTIENPPRRDLEPPLGLSEPTRRAGPRAGSRLPADNGARERAEVRSPRCRRHRLLPTDAGYHRSTGVLTALQRPVSSCDLSTRPFPDSAPSPRPPPPTARISRSGIGGSSWRSGCSDRGRLRGSGPGREVRLRSFP